MSTPSAFSPDDFAKVMSDAQYGIRGVISNIPELIRLVGSMTGTTPGDGPVPTPLE